MSILCRFKEYDNMVCIGSTAWGCVIARVVSEAISWIFQKRLLRENTPRNDTYERVYYGKLS
ncbi:MAG: hypothetical protein L3J17_01550 [Candidatus Jettenia sp.]|nr:MAG: hypothetical protein L3J17_01550 [Candidatus Jettenia sp.]